jgi:hypothetical protein
VNSNEKLGLTLLLLAIGIEANTTGDIVFFAVLWLVGCIMFYDLWVHIKDLLRKDD